MRLLGAQYPVVGEALERVTEVPGSGLGLHQRGMGAVDITQRVAGGVAHVVAGIVAQRRQPPDGLRGMAREGPASNKA